MKSMIKALASAGFVLASLCLYSSSAYAQQEKGDKEVQFVGAFFHGFGEGGNVTVGLGVVNLGYFVTRKHQVGVGLIATAANASFEGEGDTSALIGPNAFYRYNFATEGAKVFPYLSLEGGGLFTTGEDSARIGSARAALGFKYFFKRNAAFDFNAGYSRYFGTGGGESGGINLADVRMGISFIF